MNRKTLYGGIIGILSIVACAAGLKIRQSSSFINADTTTYSLSLSSSNKYSSGASKVITSNNGGEITIKYNNCVSSNGKHALINAGGSIVNSDIVHSITGLQASFTGPLQVSYSLNNTSWTEKTSITSDTKYSVKDAPYYFKLYANGGSVSLESLTVEYTCDVNPNEGGGGGGSTKYVKVASSADFEDGDYLIVYEEGSKAFNGSLSTLDAVDNNIDVEIVDDEIESTETIDNAVFTIDKTKNTVLSSSGLYIGNASNSNALTGSETAITNTMSITADGDFTCKSSGGAYLRYNAGTDQNRFRYYKSSSYTNQKPIALYKKTGSTGPVTIVGITASDSNKDNYNENSIFDTANGLVVKTVNSKGIETALNKGDYSYLIANSSGVIIDTSKPFGSAGTYTLTVNYQDFDPVVITLNVGRYEAITGLTAHMAKTTFTTAETPNLSTNLTADITWNYSDLNVTGLAYSQFSSNKIGVKLLNPSSAEVSLTNAFGTAGKYTLKIYFTTDTSMYDTVELTVNPISVTSISLDKQTMSINVGEQGSLTATVLPANATNKAYTWSTDAPLIATVDNGTVTGVAAGTATISATTSDGGLVASCTVTVSFVHITSFDIDDGNVSIEVGNTYTLSTTILPTNATNKAITWTSTVESVATVDSNGIVTGVSEGETNIIGRTVDGGLGDTVKVVVTKSSTTSGELVIRVEDIPSNYSETGVAVVGDYEFTCSNVGNSYKDGNMQWKKQIGYISNNTAINGLKTIDIAEGSGGSFSGTLYYGTSANPSTNSTSINGCGSFDIPAGNSYFKILKSTSGAGYTGDITITYSSTPVNPTGISLDNTTLSLSQGDTAQLSVIFAPSNCNTNQGITWSSNNENVATVSNTGLVTVGASAAIGGTATITATSTYNSSFKATCVVTVVEVQQDAWTVLMYICGADLESENGLATNGYNQSDIKEILSVSGQPDDVNIVIQTGGAKSWQGYNIPNNKLGRYHVSNRTLVQDKTLTNASMGNPNTLKSFIEWGIETYPADKTALIFWNHGGAMDGCCFDENYDNDSLTNDEVKTAISGAFSTLGRTKKFEFIGYDCCLMQVQDIAEFNAPYANYMLASQESEAGAGWDYDNWVDDLYAKKSTTTILSAVCDSFIKEQGTSSDQTLSYLNLANMAAYKEAWEAMASSINSIVTSKSVWNTFVNLANQAGRYGFYDEEYAEYNDGYLYDIFDAGGLLTKLKGSSTFQSASSLITAAQTALNNLVAYERHGSMAGEGHYCTGLCCFIPLCGYNYSSCYSTSKTNFTTWRSFVNRYGEYY